MDSLKNPIFRAGVGGGGGLKNPIYRGELPKKGELGRFAALKGGLAKKQKGGWSFFFGGGGGGGGLDTPMHTMMKQILVLTSFHKVL